MICTTFDDAARDVAARDVPLDVTPALRAVALRTVVVPRFVVGTATAERDTVTDGRDVALRDTVPAAVRPVTVPESPEPDSSSSVELELESYSQIQIKLETTLLEVTVLPLKLH